MKRLHGTIIFVLVLIVGLVWGLAASNQLLASRVHIGTPLIIESVQVQPVAVTHTRPASVVYAQAYLAMDAHYQPIGVWDTTRNFLQETRDEFAARTPKRQRTANSTIPRLPDLWISASQARAYAEAAFQPGDVDLMLRVADCEAGNADGIPSELNVHAKNSKSTAAGSFQHLAGWYQGRWGSFGAFDPYDPVQSFAAAAYLLYQTDSGIGNWNASKKCWSR